MPSAELLGDDLSAATLHLYLKSPTFVEYFNSFLLLPAFSSHVFYNADTGLFEQVQGAGEGGMVWGIGGVMSSASTDTLYLTDDAVGPGIVGIELHYAAQLTVQPVRGFENGGHHFPAESVLPTVNEPPTDVPSSPRYHYSCVAAHVAALISTASLQSLDRQQSWAWVTQHRLPLFLRSDLYSEYKLSRLLAAEPGQGKSERTLKSRKTASKTPSKAKFRVGELSAPSSDSDREKSSSPSKCKPSEVTAASSDSDFENSRSKLPQTSVSKPKPTDSPTPNVQLQSRRETGDSTAAILPSLPLSPSSGGIPRRSSLTALSQERHAPRTAVNISTSKSDVELGSNSSSRLSRGHKRSLSSNTVLTALESPRGKRVEEKSSSADKPTTKLIPEEYRFLGTKTGMGLFWRFLRGKAGEKNWLFWLDAERIKYYSLPTDQQRLLRELREHYLQSGSPLKLPPEARRGMVGASLSLHQVAMLQTTLANGLKKYWCPRFILHHRHKQQPLPQPQPSNNEFAINYPRLPHPLTPSQTPTFRRLTSGRPRSKSSPVGYKRPNREEEGRGEGEGEGTEPPDDPDPGWAGGRGRGEPRETSWTQTVEGSPSTSSRGSGRKVLQVWSSSRTTDLEPCQSGVEERGMSSHRRIEERGTSGGVSDEVGVEERGASGSRLSSRKESRGGRSSVARHSRLAKYTNHRLPDVSSRCASAMDSYDAPSPRMCDSRCQILSVSGTPLLCPSTPSYSPTIDYPLLVNCLATEQRKAGGYFQEHLQGLEDKMYLHCLFFWRDVQEYKTLFTGASFSPCAVEMKAKAIYGHYIVDSSGESIGCPTLLASSVSANLWPAYEDLFDGTEEFALGVLMEQWMELCCHDDRIFQKLDVLPVSVSRLCSARSSRHAIGLEDVDEEMQYDCEDGTFPTPRSPSPTKHTLHPSNPTSSRASPRHSTPLLTRTPTPSQSRAISLNDIIENPIEVEHFKVFLNEHFAAMDLMCWMEIEAFRGIPASDKPVRDIRAKQLRSRFFCKKYFFGPSSPASKDAQRQVVAAGGSGYGGRLPSRPKTPVFREAQKHVRGRLEKKWLSEFIATPEFIARNGGSNINGKKNSRAVGSAQRYEKSLANSREALLFRKALQEHSSREHFVRYSKTMAMGGSHSRENVEFWVECQRYKEMCHAHTTEQTLQCKVAAMIDCYFQSPVPPKLQIDIHQSIADQVVKKSLGPYIFREAQAAVFKNLFYLWQSYQEFCNGSSDTQVDAALRKLEMQTRDLQQTAKEKEAKVKLEEEQKRSLMPRFETLAERELRLKREREFAAFGEVAVAFSLSTPNPKYKYFTEIPGESDEDEMLQEEGALLSETALAPKGLPWENGARRVSSRRQRTAAEGSDQASSRKLCWGEPTPGQLPREGKERLKKTGILKPENLETANKKLPVVPVTQESTRKLIAQHRQDRDSDPSRHLSAFVHNQRTAKTSDRVLEQSNRTSFVNTNTKDGAHRLKKRMPSPSKNKHLASQCNPMIPSA